jgi:selenocysteine lyase/cysteine desulfurase
MSAVASLSPYRVHFSIPTGMHYLNCAYMAPLSRGVEGAAHAAMLRQRAPVDIPPAEYFTGPHTLRSAFARLINAPRAEQIAIVPSVSYAMETAARNIPLTREHNVVVIGEEFPSAVLPWRSAARASGATLRTVGRTMHWNEALYDAIDRDTAVVVLAHVHWSDGTRFDVVSLAARAREVGAAVVIDGTQSVGALAFDVAAVQPDLLVCAGYKWLMGGYGLAVAYYGERLLHGTPLEHVWTSQTGSDDFARLAEYRDAFRADASRFDGGERASFTLVPMLRTSIDQLLLWGTDAIQRHCSALVEPWIEKFLAAGVTMDDPATRTAHLFALRFADERNAGEVAERLRRNNVHLSVRGDALRVSPHLYNDDEDMAALCDALG